MLKWTTKYPDQEGRYWVREVDPTVSGHRPRVVVIVNRPSEGEWAWRVCQSTFEEYGTPMLWFKGCEWAGPIPLPVQGD